MSHGTRPLYSSAVQEKAGRKKSMRQRSVSCLGETHAVRPRGLNHVWDDSACIGNISSSAPGQAADGHCGGEKPTSCRGAQAVLMAQSLVTVSMWLVVASWHDLVVQSRWLISHGFALVRRINFLLR